MAEAVSSSGRTKTVTCSLVRAGVRVRARGRLKAWRSAWE
jgi:hypothetical protein